MTSIRDDEPLMADLRGHEVVGEQGQVIGKITDVIYDEASNQATYAVVNLSGLLTGSHYVPLQHSFQANDGRLVVPFAKHVVKSSPRAGRDHVMTSQLAEELRRYYGSAA